MIHLWYPLCIVLMIKGRLSKMDTRSRATASETNTPTTSPPSPIEQTADLVRRVTRLLRQGSQEDWTSLSLSRAQLRILILLQKEGATSVGQLAAHLGVTLPSITATVDRLVQADYVAREGDPHDRRRVINRLTPTGQALLERLQEGRRARLVAALERLSPEELSALRGVMARFEQVLKETENGTG